MIRAALTESRSAGYSVTRPAETDMVPGVAAAHFGFLHTCCCVPKSTAGQASSGAWRTFGWLTRYRRHGRDYEKRTDHSEAIMTISMIHLMLKRLDKSPAI
jgi:hypothetical protein